MAKRLTSYILIARVLGLVTGWAILDMGRSATNVIGNAVAASVIARWEGDFETPEPPDIEPPHAPSYSVAGA